MGGINVSLFRSLHPFCPKIQNPLPKELEEWEGKHQV